MLASPIRRGEMILLTDEEVLEVWGLSGTGNIARYINPDDRKLLKAQVKKVVEYLDTFKDKPVGEEVKLFIDRIRQALLEAIE